jgi:hypothetical protein
MRILELLSVSLIGIATTVGVSVVGCGSSSSSGPAAVGSDQGQSCTRTADCASGLVCISNTCFASSATISIDGGAVDGSVTTADGSTTTPPPQGGPEALGQACAATIDCATGYTCVPFSSAVGGLCDYTNFGLNPDAGSTGKVCGGECTQASDCCELPPPGYTTAGTFYNYSDAGVYLGGPSTTVYADQCAAVLQALGGSAAGCSSPTGPNATAISTMCYYYETYCASTCAANWSCTNNSCLYTGACTVGASSETVGACATYTRAGRTVNATCTPSPDAGTAGTCAPSGGSCAVATDCNGQTIADPSVLENRGTKCVGGDCTCYQNKCYFACAQDIDCAGGYSCNTSTHLCTQAMARGCQSNNDCATISMNGMGANAKAICQTATNTCAVPCTTDHDCSRSSGAVPALGSFSGYVCSAGYCTAVSTTTSSCSTNADCESTGTGAVNTFCVTPATPGTFESAISGGKGM